MALTCEPCGEVLGTISAGLIFGFAMDKARVVEPRIIRQQMVMENFTMMKMFLSATATSMLTFSLLSMIPKYRPSFYKAWDKFTYCLTGKTFFVSSLGAFICGCGMAVAGSCPGLVFCQVGVGVPNAVYTLLGGLFGAAVYPNTFQYFPEFMVPSKPVSTKRLDEILCTPLFSVALPLAACLGIVVFALEEFYPWTTEIEQGGSGIFGLLAWPPFIAGMLVGATQFISVTVNEKSLGTTGAYTVLIAQLQQYLPYCQTYFAPFVTGLCNHLQVIFVSCLIFGAFLSGYISNSLVTAAGVNPIMAFAGGTLMIFGARLAGGCTSGHGLSGLGFLSLHSLLAVPAMFGGAILTGCLLKYGLGVPDLPPVDVAKLISE